MSTSRKGLRRKANSGKGHIDGGRWGKMVLQSLVITALLFRLIVLIPYWLFLKLPSRPAYVLGMFRVISWSLFLIYFDFDALYQVTEDNKPIQLLAVLLPFACIGVLVGSLTVLFGFHYPLSLGSAYSGNFHPNIKSTLDVLDGQLSSYKARSNFIDGILQRGKKTD